VATGEKAEPAVAKTIWTEADFDAMSWHDNAIHAVAVEPVPDHPGRLLLDLDYIVGGVRPEPSATRLSFWICPATLVFDEAWDLTADVDLRGWSFQLFISDISRSGGIVSEIAENPARSEKSTVTSRVSPPSSGSFFDDSMRLMTCGAR